MPLKEWIRRPVFLKKIGILENILIKRGYVILIFLIAFFNSFLNFKRLLNKHLRII